MRNLSREQLEAEVIRLQGLLTQAGLNATLASQEQSQRDAVHVSDLSIRRAETAAARDSTLIARAATSVAGAQLDRSEVLVAELRASQARLDAVIETVPVGILVAEAPSGRIIMGNGRTEEVLGHPPIYASSTGGYTAYVAFHADGRSVAATEWPLAKIASGGADRAELECRYQRPDGSRTWINVTGEAIKGDDGATIGAVVVFRSIDDRKAAEAA